MSFLGELFKVISYYNDAENPIDNDTILMDTWDELTEEQQRNYLKSLLYGAVIAVSVAGAYKGFDVLFGAKLETATDNALKFIKEKGKSYMINKSINELENDLLGEASSTSENLEFKKEISPDKLPEYSYKTYTNKERLRLIEDDSIQKFTQLETVKRGIEEVCQLVWEGKAIILDDKEEGVYTKYLASKFSK